MDTDPTPLDYRSPQFTTKPVFSVSSFVYSGFVVAVLVLDMLVVVPQFEAIFRDFGTALPLLTILLLKVSRSARRWWPILLVIPVVIGFLAAAMSPARVVGEPPRRRPKSWMFLLITLALAAIVLVTVVGLFLPMISLIQTVSGK